MRVAWLAVVALDLEHGVGAQQPGLRLTESLRGPVALEAQLSLLTCGGGSMSVSPSHVEQRAAEHAAVREHPGVELEVVEDVAVVVDPARREPLARRDDLVLLEETVSGVAEVVGPGK